MTSGGTQDYHISGSCPGVLSGPTNRHSRARGTPTFRARFHVTKWLAKCPEAWDEEEPASHLPRALPASETAVQGLRNIVCMRIARPMSPLILSLPLMNAAVGSRPPVKIFTKSPESAISVRLGSSTSPCPEVAF